MATRPNKRNAAAVVLTRGDGSDLEILLVERSPELRFFGGYHAVPGGVRGPEDGPDDADGSDVLPLARCAVRELFEETGVALDADLQSLKLVDRVALRQGLLAGAAEAAQRVARHIGGSPDIDVLCRFVTPPFAPVRYDTVFFTARLPIGQEPKIERGELVGGRFWRPREALDRWRAGQLSIVPPVLILLELLDGADLDTFRRHAGSLAERYLQGELHRVRFSPGVLMASLRTPTLPPATTTNCLIVGEQRLFIIDPATPYPDEQRRLFDLLDRLRDEGRELCAVLSTHHHADHVGAVHAVSERYDLPVRAHARTLSRLAPGFRAGAPIADRERIDLGRAPDGSADWQLEAIFTPGHDQGHLSFRETRYDAVAVGDMLSTVSTIVIDPPEGHLRTYLDSLDRLLDEPMGTLYPAHGPAVRDGHRLVRHYQKHRAEREGALIEALRRGPATPDELVQSIYVDTDPRLFPLAERSLLAGLLKLEEDGVAARRAAGDETGPWSLAAK